MGIIEQYKGLSKANYVMFIGKLVTTLGAMVMPMLTLLLNQKFGMSASLTAFWVMMAGLIALPANLIGGYMADRFSKKWLIVFCDIISVILYIWGGTRELTFTIFILIILASFTQTIEGPAYQALVVEVTPEGKQDKAFSLLYMGGNIGMMVAPTIAGLLFNNYLWLCFILDGVTIGLSTLLILLFVDEKKESVNTIYEGRNHLIEEESIVKIFGRNPALILYTGAMVLYMGAYTQFSYLMPLELTRIHGNMGSTIYGTITSVSCLVVVILNPIITKIIEAKTSELKLLIGIFMQIVGFAVFLLFLGKIPGYYFAIVLFTIGEILTVIADAPFIAQNVPKEYHGRVFGLTSFFCSLAGGFVMYVSGRLFDSGANKMAWIFTIIVCIVALLLALKLYYSNSRSLISSQSSLDTYSLHNDDII